MTKRDDGLKSYFLEQLDGLGDVSCRRMFGGYGLYQGPIFFGIIFQDRLYFKTDAASARDYQAAGMSPFRPSARQTLSSYYEVPGDVIDDRETLVAWAERAVAARGAS